MRLRPNSELKLDVQISPLIDVVFLLLIYFMITASLVRKEADLSFTLPGPPGPPIEIPVNAFIEVRSDGGVFVDGVVYTRTDKLLAGLADQIRVLRRLALSQNSELTVSILPDQNTVHQRVMDVMNACAAAGVEKLAFGNRG